MAKLCLINNATYKPGKNNIGDIVAVYEDSVTIPAKEASLFDFATVPGTADEVRAGFVKIRPVYKAPSLEWVEKVEMKHAWLDPKTGELKDIVMEPKYRAKFKDGKISDNFSDKPENATVLITADKVK